MRERPLPEAIRGSWYYILASADPRDPGDRGVFVYRFRLDGTFTLYTIREDSWVEKEKGDYTFDGAFLIVRGRNTDTYRVRCESFWRWRLEGKKEDWVLVRALVAAEEFTELSEAERKEIRILPIRVTARNRFDQTDAVYDLVYSSGGVEKIVGALFTEHDPSSGQMWIGLTVIAQGIEPKTWERIVRESFLDIHLGKPESVHVVTLRTLNTNESNVFNYALS